MAPLSRDRKLVLAALESACGESEIDTARNMLRYAFPHTVTKPGESGTQYQEEVLSLIKNHLNTLVDKTRELIETEGFNVKDCESNVALAENTVEAATASVEQADQDVQSRQSILAELQVKVQECKARHKQIEKNSEEFLNDRLETEGSRTSTQKLLDSLDAEGPVAKKMLNELTEFLQENRADKALVAALPAAVSVGPDMRNAFDNVVLDFARRKIREKLEELDKNIKETASEVEHAKAEVLGAWAMMSCARDDANEAEAGLTEASEKLKERKDEKNLAIKLVKDLKTALSAALVKQTLAETKMTEINEAVEAFERLQNPSEPVPFDAPFEGQALEQKVIA